MENALGQAKVIVGLDTRNTGRRQLLPKSGRVIPASAAKLSRETVKIIGGDSDDVEQTSPPAIILEKKNDEISKIIVKCPCGRHAELICQYDE